MKTLTVYLVRTSNPKFNAPIESQYLLLKEFHLIKTMLNDGLRIHGVDKVELTPEQYKHNFG